MTDHLKRIFLRIQYARETGRDVVDSVAGYADWLEKKLVSVLTETQGEPVPDFEKWVELLQKQKEQ